MPEWCQPLPACTASSRAARMGLDWLDWLGGGLSFRVAASMVVHSGRPVSRVTSACNLLAVLWPTHLAHQASRRLRRREWSGTILHVKPLLRSCHSVKL